MQLSNDTLSSDIDRASVKSNPPPSPSASSRYSLQPVPRIPSFKFSGGRSFTSPLEDESHVSPKPRALSLDWGNQLKSLPEEESPISRSGSNSSLRRAMMQFSIDEKHGNVHDSDDLYSAHGHSSPRGGSLSISDDISRKEDQNIHSAVQSSGFLGADNSWLDTFGVTDSLQKQLTAPDIATSTSLSAVSSLSHEINQKSLSAASNAVSPRSLSPMHGETSIRSSEDTVPPMATRGSSLEVSREFPSAGANLPSRTHHISRFYRNNSTDLTDNARNQSISNSSLDKATSRERNVQSPVSPPLPDTKGLHSQNNERRLSSDSQVSDMSKDEMDRIREKFDEDAQLSPTGSKVSALSEDEDKDLDAILEEKLGEESFDEDIEKSQAIQQPRRPSAPRHSSQPISVVRLSRLPQERRVSQSAESTKRYSRFSFESDRNAMAEAMLVTGYGKPRLVDSSQEQNMASQVPETLGEEAPDEPPPPFDEPTAPYGADEKDAKMDERISVDYSRRNEPPSPRGEYGSTQQSPPQYQPLRSHPPNPEPTRRENRLSETHAHRDSHNSSISSLSNAVTNPNARVTISPEPRSSRPKQPATFDSNSQMQKMKEQENPMSQSSKSRWTDGRFSREAQPGPVSNNSLSAVNGSLFGPGRREEDSFGSGDSMAVQAALSRNDLRAEPSPLHRESETASATSGNSLKASVPFKDRIKFVGKRARGISIDAPGAEEPAERKAGDKSKKLDKKVEGKKGAFNKISVCSYPGFISDCLTSIRVSSIGRIRSSALDKKQNHALHSMIFRPKIPSQSMLHGRDPIHCMLLPRLQLLLRISISTHLPIQLITNHSKLPRLAMERVYRHLQVVTMLLHHPQMLINLKNTRRIPTLLAPINRPMNTNIQPKMRIHLMLRKNGFLGLAIHTLLVLPLVVLDQRHGMMHLLLQNVGGTEHRICVCVLAALDRSRFDRWIAIIITLTTPTQFIVWASFMQLLRLLALVISRHRSQLLCLMEWTEVNCLPETPFNLNL